MNLNKDKLYIVDFGRYKNDYLVFGRDLEIDNGCILIHQAIEFDIITSSSFWEYLSPINDFMYNYIGNDYIPYKISHIKYDQVLKYENIYESMKIKHSGTYLSLLDNIKPDRKTSKLRYLEIVKEKIEKELLKLKEEEKNTTKGLFWYFSKLAKKIRKVKKNLRDLKYITITTKG
jgi:viroplasmin and RNaseH domain-containing protein